MEYLRGLLPEDVACILADGVVDEILKGGVV